MTALNIFVPYVVAADQHLYYTDPTAAQGAVILLNGQATHSASVVGQWSLNPDATLTILGSVGMVFDSGAFVLGIEEGNDASNSPFFVTIGQGGSFALACEGQAEGYWGEAPFTNNGSFYVSAAQSAEGVRLQDFSGRVNDLSGFDNTGVFTVRGQGALGVENVRGHFFNSGTITVDGEGSYATAAIIAYGATVTNSGVITADTTGLSIGAPYGFNIPPNMPDNRPYPSMMITNTGVITAPTAISTPGATVVSVLHLENSGTINGGIWAAGVSTAAGSDHGTVIHNTGAINGKITLDGFGDDVYDGRGGTLSGGIVFTSGGGGFDTFYLGNDGESVLGVSSNGLGDPVGAANLTVYGGAGNDTILGGLGVNYIDGGAGNDVLTGGGKVSTVAFASAALGVTASLALQGTAQDTGDGLKTLTNFQNLTGSAFTDHLTGDSRNNVIDGGGGSDLLTGGGGGDTFAFRLGYGREEITDFSHADGDRIDLSGFFTLDSLQVLLAHAVPSGGNTLITLPGGGDLALDGVSMASLQASDFILPRLTHDFTDTGVSDVLFRNPTTGDWGFMSVTASGQAWRAIGPSSPGYAAMGVGDFNGDGVLDTAFRNTSTGDWGFLTINPSGGETWHAVGPSSLSYDAIATGHFNGEGSADVLFRNPTTGDWGYMSVSAPGGQAWHPIGASSPGYAFIGSGDFNGDGVMDAAFRQASTGDWGFLSINPSGGESWRAVGPSSVTYAAIATGDFDDDGSTDILFRNPTTGDWGFMSVSASAGQTWHPIGPSSPDYAFLSAGDFNGDGVMDAAFRQVATGNWGYLSIDHGGGETWHYVGPSSTDYMAV